ncbi:MAG: hypothetical protein CVV44_10650 [Spirochaetae bacterium HGW-Spirochaetae-1]|jgi:rubrerythrin|nr:MAG: hypothetical protein CVV44_10650 [Spirochaetae bacterium HGW-Spirochaetae-1]
MKEEYLEFAVLLEKGLAGFYENMKKQDRFGRIKQVLEFMETHSFEHAERLAEISETTDKPALGESMILDYQNTVTKKVNNEIKGENDLMKILQVLADSEEKLGDLYNNTAETMSRLSRHYSILAEHFKDIAGDEYKHRDLLMADKKRLEEKEGGKI